MKPKSFNAFVFSNGIFIMYNLNNLNETVDGKFIVTKNLSNQAPVGTLIHIMDAKRVSDRILVNYRITETSQDYVAEFSNINDFNKWIKSDPFIARNYESFSKEDVQHYIKADGRTFTGFCLPIMIIAIILVWLIAILAIKSIVVKIIVGIILSAIAGFGVFIFYKRAKTSAKMKLYQKVSDKWNVSFS